jgi:metallo-beta-lactamase family protein
MTKLTFYGATEGVTGSSYVLETGNKTILLDCGLFQGSREEEKLIKSPFNLK